MKFASRVKFYLKRRFHEKIVFKIGSNETVFTSIWRNNYWGSDESLSGPGSTWEQTKNVRNALPIIFKDFNIKTVFDAPCGDLNWMKEVIEKNSIDYIGGDIVKGIIDQNKKYQNSRVRFFVFDMTVSNFPKADLWICRDLFFHLSYKDIFKSLRQFVKSDIPYLLTTTHINSTNFENINITSGDFRKIDIFRTPFNFNQLDVLFRFEDYIEPQLPREMCLFTRENVQNILELLENNY